MKLQKEMIRLREAGQYHKTEGGTLAFIEVGEKVRKRSRGLSSSSSEKALEPGKTESWAGHDLSDTKKMLESWGPLASAAVARPAGSSAAEKSEEGVDKAKVTNTKASPADAEEQVMAEAKALEADIKGPKAVKFSAAESTELATGPGTEPQVMRGETGAGLAGVDCEEATASSGASGASAASGSTGATGNALSKDELKAMAKAMNAANAKAGTDACFHSCAWECSQGCFRQLSPDKVRNRQIAKDVVKHRIKVTEENKKAIARRIKEEEADKSAAEEARKAEKLAKMGVIDKKDVEENIKDLDESADKMLKNTTQINAERLREETEQLDDAVMDLRKWSPA
jgi:hypothetical protein